jgi:hypothetical protein
MITFLLWYLLIGGLLASAVNACTMIDKTDVVIAIAFWPIIVTMVIYDMYQEVD